MLQATVPWVVWPWTLFWKLRSPAALWLQLGVPCQTAVVSFWLSFHSCLFFLFLLTSTSVQMAAGRSNRLHHLGLRTNHCTGEWSPSEASPLPKFNACSFSHFLVDPCVADSVRGHGEMKALSPSDMGELHVCGPKVLLWHLPVA